MFAPSDCRSLNLYVADLLELTSILILGLGAQWLAWRLRVPAVPLIILVGLLAGPGLEFLGRIPALPLSRAVHPELLFSGLMLPLVSLGTAVLLFQAGLALRFADLRASGVGAWRLSIGSVLVAAPAITLGAHFLLDQGWLESAVLAGVLLAAGPCELAPRDRRVRALRSAGAVSEAESTIRCALGPLAAVLLFVVLFAAESAEPAAGPVSVTALALLNTLLFGGALGAACAWLVALLLRLSQVPGHLQQPVALLFLAVALAWGELFQPGAGLFAAVVLGLVLANQRLADVGRIADAHGPLYVLLVPSLLMLLAARLPLSALSQIGWESVVFVAGLIVVVRPIAILLAALRTGLRPREKLFLACIAPRGVLAAALASVFALHLEEEGRFTQADALVATTLLVVVVTGTVHAIAAAPLARREKSGRESFPAQPKNWTAL